MLQHMFAVMNELLDDIMKHYYNANGQQKDAMNEQLAVLQSMSDTVIDGWLQVEEKLALLRDPPAAASGAAASASEAEPSPEADCMPPPKPEAEEGSEEGGMRKMVEGQGYFKLCMYKEAAALFQQAVGLCPDSVVARLYLAMSHMHLLEWEEAQQHFLLIVRWTAHPKWKALGLNALGCIQAIRFNMEQAEAYFKEAKEADPTFMGAARNLTSCKANAGHLSLYFGSAELSCL